MKLSADGNGGSTIHLPKFKPGSVKITLGLGTLLWIVAIVFSIASAFGKARKIYREWDGVVSKVEANCTEMVQTRKCMRALLKQMKAMSEKLGVEVLYDESDFFEE